MLGLACQTWSYEDGSIKETSQQPAPRMSEQEKSRSRSRAGAGVEQEHDHDDEYEQSSQQFKSARCCYGQVDETAYHHESSVAALLQHRKIQSQRA